MCRILHTRAHPLSATAENPYRTVAYKLPRENVYPVVLTTKLKKNNGSRCWEKRKRNPGRFLLFVVLVVFFAGVAQSSLATFMLPLTCCMYCRALRAYREFLPNVLQVQVDP